MFVPEWSGHVTKGTNFYQLQNVSLKHVSTEKLWNVKKKKMFPEMSSLLDF